MSGPEIRKSDLIRKAAKAQPEYLQTGSPKSLDFHSI